MKSKGFSRLIADYTYNNPIAEGKDTVRFLLSPVKDYSKPYVLLVIAQPVISPMNYPLETYELIQLFLLPYSIDLRDVDIYLDYEERFKPSRTNLTNWVFTEKKGKFESDKLNDVLAAELPAPIREIRDQYYKDFVYDQNHDLEEIEYKRNNSY